MFERRDAPTSVASWPPNSPLSAHDLSTGYTRGRQRKVISAGLNLALCTGELVALLGPNGAGKSTLMRTLTGMQPPLHGEVIVGGAPLRRLSARDLARKMAVVLTDRVEAGNLNAYTLAALGRHPYTSWDGRLSADDEAIVQAAMRAAHCEALARRPVSELSDGERQRVMIARALAQETPIILLDEPTAFLDLPRRIEIMHLLRSLAHETDRALLVSTHDLELAMRYADVLWLMGSDGAFVSGAPDSIEYNGDLLRIFASEGEEVMRYLRALHKEQPQG